MNEPKPCDKPKFIDDDDGVALVIKDYTRRTDYQFLRGGNPENDSDDFNVLCATMALLVTKKNINKLRGRIYDLGDSVDFDRPIKVAQRACYDSNSFEAGLTRSFDLIDVMMAAEQLGDELQELVDDWLDWDSSDTDQSVPPPEQNSPPPDSQPPPDEKQLAFNIPIVTKE